MVDKLSILKIKKEFINDTKKIVHINKEYNVLLKKYQNIQSENKFLETQFNKLYETNKKLWIIEDEIRKLEIKKDFSEDFIELARSVYFTNDIRFEIKNLINLKFNSEIAEQKQYESYK